MFQTRALTVFAQKALGSARHDLRRIRSALLLAALFAALASGTLHAQTQILKPHPADNPDRERTLWTVMQDASLTLGYYDVKSTRTRVVEAGGGKPFILLHGGGGLGMSFIPEVIEFSDKFHVYLVQMVGHGFTDHRPGIDYTVNDLSEHIKEFMDVAGIERTHIYGVSLGAWVAAWLAHKYPERVDRVVLNAADGLVGCGWSDAVAENVRLVKLSLANPTAEVIRKRHDHLGRRDPNARLPLRNVETDETRAIVYQRPSVQAALGTLFNKGYPYSFEHQMMTPERLRSIKARTLFLWSSNDPTCPWQQAEKASKFVPDAKFVVVDAQGHNFRQYYPTTFNRIVRDFLSE